MRTELGQYRRPSIWRCGNVPKLVDPRVWAIHPLNPKNRIETDRLIQTDRGPENVPIGSRTAPDGDDLGDLRRVSAVQ
jgi:hypothetical protein